MSRLTREPVLKSNVKDQGYKATYRNAQTRNAL